MNNENKKNTWKLWASALLVVVAGIALLVTSFVVRKSPGQEDVFQDVTELGEDYSFDSFEKSLGCLSEEELKNSEQKKQELSRQIDYLRGELQKFLKYGGIAVSFKRFDDEVKLMDLYKDDGLTCFQLKYKATMRGYDGLENVQNAAGIERTKAAMRGEPLRLLRAIDDVETSLGERKEVLLQGFIAENKEHLELFNLVAKKKSLELLLEYAIKNKKGVLDYDELRPSCLENPQHPKYQFGILNFCNNNFGDASSHVIHVSKEYRGLED